MAANRNHDRATFIAALLAAFAITACGEVLEDPGADDGAEYSTAIAALSMDDLPPGLNGSYYDRTEFRSYRFTRIDPVINFNWGSGRPHPTMGANTFSIRWIGYFRPPVDGDYYFYPRSDDGVRMWFDGNLIVDHWVNHPPREHRGDALGLVAGKAYRVVLEYYEQGGGAVIELRYAGPGIAKQYPPSSVWSVRGDGTGLHGRYYAEPADLFEPNATAELEVVEPSLDFDWGAAAPHPGVSIDFAQRLTGFLEPVYTGDHRFRVTCQGKYRMWLGLASGARELRVDRWTVGDDTQWQAEFSTWLDAGERVPLSIEYADNSGVASCNTEWMMVTGRPDDAFGPIPSSQLFPVRTGTGTGLEARYYDNRDQTNLLSVQTDPTIDFEWGRGSPTLANGVPMGSDRFSVVWDGEVEPTYSEEYTFYTRTDDGVRLWVDNVLIVNRWRDQAPTEDFGRITLAAGQRYSIRMQYYENRGGAVAQLRWSSPSQSKEIIPSTQLYLPPVDPSGGLGLEGNYYGNQDFTGFDRMRLDPMVNFNWGSGSPFPGESFGADTFSIRWLGQVRPRYTERYTFHTWTDDGVRLWVNNRLIIDNWRDMAPTESTGTIDLIAGKRYDLRMDYYERGGGAVARLLWSSPTQAEEPIPQPRLYPPPQLGAGEGLLGEYFYGRNFDDMELRLVRVDDRVTFTYTDTPPSDVLPPSDHSIRWRGQFEAIYDETYTLTLRTSGAVRLRINGGTAIDEWHDDGDNVVEYSVDLAMETGMLYDIEIDYFQDDVGGTIELLWESPSQVKMPIPTRQLYPASPNARVEFGECESVLQITQFEPEGGGELPDGLAIDGGLTLEGQVITTPDLWVASNYRVERIDTARGERISTYPAGKDASRTAVDLNHNVWVANRAFGATGSVTKVIADCVCPDDPNAWCNECVAFTVDLGYNTVPRGLAIDAENNVWVGLFNRRELVKLDNETGQILGRFPLSFPGGGSYRTYGLAIDLEGKIWIATISSSQGVACFDTVTEEMCGQFLPGGTCLRPYGIAVDGDMNVWFGNWSCGGLGYLDRESYDISVAANTDPTTGLVNYRAVTADITVFTDPAASYTRGVAVDAHGMIWLASSGSHRVLQFDPTARDWVGSYPTASVPIGVGISDEGHAWAVSRNGRQANAFDSAGNRVYSVSTIGSGYSYSDMTGFQLRNFTAPQGVWNMIYDCTDMPCVFDYVSWDAITPEETVVQVRVRVGDPDPVTGDPIWGDWSPAYRTTPSPLGRAGYDGQLVEVELTLYSAPNGQSPTVQAVQLWRCPQIFQPSNLDLDDRWIVDQDAPNYAISWQITDDSWPETRWEFIDDSENIRCLLESTTSIHKGQVYSGAAPFPACVEEHHISNVPIPRAVRTAYYNEDLVEWQRSSPSVPISYYTLVNNPTELNADMRFLGKTADSVLVNWCRPQNNWSAGLTGSRLERSADPAFDPAHPTYALLADFPTDTTASGTERGYASDLAQCGNMTDAGLANGTLYYYRLTFQNGDAAPSEPLVLSVETYGAPCCDELALGCEGVCNFAVTGPTGCELPPIFEDPEITCDELDNDCDGLVDEGLENACGFCGPVPVEVCDGLDNDCNGLDDDNPVVGPTYYADADGDGFGDVGAQRVLCAAEPGWVLDNTDCDDTRAAINPAADEICDGFDNDCDGDIDESGGVVTFYRDGDSDGFGSPDSIIEACVAPPGYLSDNTDCDDTRASVNPAAAEICDGIDNNCDGNIDDGFAAVTMHVLDVRTTADVGVDACDNAYAGLACTGAMAVEFQVANPSTFTVPTDVMVDFRFDDAAGPRVTDPEALAAPVGPGETATFTYCFGTEYNVSRDLFIQLQDLGDHIPACGVASDVYPDASFVGGVEACDGIDNDCDGERDEGSCGATYVCVFAEFDLEYQCVMALTEEGGDCGDEVCVIECEDDLDCSSDAVCVQDACVESRWLAAESAAVDPAGEAPASGERAVQDEPGRTGCSSVPERDRSSAVWAGLLFALFLGRRRLCRGVRRH